MWLHLPLTSKFCECLCDSTNLSMVRVTSVKRPQRPGSKSSKSVVERGGLCVKVNFIIYYQSHILVHQGKIELTMKLCAGMPKLLQKHISVHDEFGPLAGVLVSTQKLPRSQDSFSSASSENLAYQSAWHASGKPV